MTDISNLSAGDEVIVGRGRNSGQRVKITSVGTDVIGVILPNGEPAVITKTNVRVPEEPTIAVSAIVDALAGIDSDKLAYGPLDNLLNALDVAAPGSSDKIRANAA